MLITPVLAALLIGNGAADYRSRFPMPDLAVPSGFAVNVNLREATDEDMNAMRDLGAKWARIDLLWSRVEQKAGVYDFSRYDPLVEGLARRGMRPILILDYGNKVYDVDAPRTREGRTAFAAFAAAAVKHYRQQGVLWEIWNEPNLSHFWRGEPSAEEYAALVRVVVPAMREVSTDEWIMGPGTSRFDWDFLKTCFQQGVLSDFDAVSVHPYRDKAEPESVDVDWARLRGLIEQFAPKGKTMPMICSEWGYSTYSKGVSPQKQGQLAMRMYLSNLAAGVPLTVWYSWKDRPDASSEKEKSFGLFDAAGFPKAGYSLVQSGLLALDGYQLDTRVEVNDSDTMALLFRKGSEKKLALWSSAPKPSELTLPATLAPFVGFGRHVQLGNAVQVLPSR